MDILLITLLTVLSFSKVTVVNAVTVEVYIHPAGPRHFSYVGSALTLSCIVSGQANSPSAYILKWSFNTATVLPCTADGSTGALLYEKGCNLTINPVELSSEGVYMCDLFDKEGREIRDSLELYVIDDMTNTTVDLMDLFTGDLVDINSDPVCLKPGLTRTFECSVRRTIPGTWKIAWIIGKKQKHNGSNETTSSTAGGLVNVSSMFTLPESGNELLNTNLGCQATRFNGKPLSIAVQLQSCEGVHQIPGIDIIDLSTGELVDINSMPICIQSDIHTGQTFQCTVREAKPGDWNITWVADKKEVKPSFIKTTPSAGGLVNVSSSFSLSESLLKTNLSCQATSIDGESLSVTVQLQSCKDVHPKPTIDMKDLSTGHLVDIDSVSCFQPDTQQSFMCTVREIKPGHWNITWVVDETEMKPGFITTTRSTGGLVNVSSMFNTSTLPNRGVTRKLACYARGLDTELLNITMKLTTCAGKVPNAVMYVVDLLTGDLVGTNSKPSCVKAGTARTFECTVRHANSDVSMSWVIHNSSTETVSVNVTPSTGELVDMRSKYTVFNSRDEGLIDTIACLATGVETDLLVSVQLESCVENVPVVNADMILLVAVISVLGAVLVLVGIAFAIFAARTKRTKQMTLPPSVRASQDVDQSVEMANVASDKESDSPTPEATPTYENKIISHAVSSREDSDAGLPSWAEGWGILWSDLGVDERILGSGNFGEVRSGTVRKDGDLTRSAIKMLKGHASRSDRDDFMDEFWTMASIGYHPNIVLLLGACQHQDVLYVALEYLPHGDLRSYLRTARSQSDSDEDALSSEQLVKFSLDVACGMEHLARAGVIHRDLAARNILLGEGLVAKVSDFGLSRGEDIYVQTSRRRVPLRWLAIESVKHQMYTSQSDVWSFGILLWEIATFGGTPYPSIQNEMLAATIKRGYRMPKPDNCHDQIYALMRECWDEDPNSRPTFSDLVYILIDMADNQIKHTYMAVVRDEYQNLSAIRPELDDD